MEMGDCDLIDIAPTISNIFDIPMVQPEGKVIQEIVEYAEKNECKKAVIIIVDSLGYSLYRHLLTSMKNTDKIAKKGLLLKCSSPAGHTTPAISSIFTGHTPEQHHVYKTDDIYIERAKDGSNPRIRTIMEWTHDKGLTSGIVIESQGAAAMVDRIDLVYGVPDSKDIIEYDKNITSDTIKALSNDPKVLAVHLRAVDRYAHRAQNWKEIKVAANAVDKNIGKIFSNAEKGTLFFICGDHPIHSADRWLKFGSKEDTDNHQGGYVALIIGSS